MAKVIGQLDSLKSLRSRLNQNGIRDFNSVGDLNTFISTYDNAKQKILEEVEQQFEHEFEALKRMQNLISDSYRRASKAFKENDDAQLKILDAKRRSFNKEIQR